MKKLGDFEELKRLCEKEGFRLTAQRLEIFKEISAAKDHPSVEMLYERLKKKMPTISLDTVYRTLTMFEKMGIVRRIHTTEPFLRFDPDVSPHHHLFCQKCGKIIDFKWPEIDKLDLPEHIGQLGLVQSKQIQLIGLCKKCMSKEEKEETK